MWFFCVYSVVLLCVGILESLRAAFETPGLAWPVCGFVQAVSGCRAGVWSSQCPPLVFVVVSLVGDSRDVLRSDATVQMATGGIPVSPATPPPPTPPSPSCVVEAEEGAEAERAPLLAVSRVSIDFRVQRVGDPGWVWINQVVCPYRGPVTLTECATETAFCFQ